MMTPDEIQKAVDAPPRQAATRNINTDVHIGHAAQRPYAALEDNLAFRQGYQSFAEMQAAGADIQQDASGDWFRVKAKPTGNTALSSDGKTLMTEHIEERRPVALSLALAKAGHADFWDGYTWVLGGLKREKEYAANLGTAGVGQGTWVPIGPAPVLPQPSPAGTLQPLPSDAVVTRAAPADDGAKSPKKEG